MKRKLPTLVLVALVICVILYFALGHSIKKEFPFLQRTEGFAVEKVFHFPKLYDSFYASIYDQLFYIPAKNKLEISDIESQLIKNKYEQVRFLDAGCGTGRHLALLSRKMKTTGLDISKAMLRKARQNTKDSEYPVELVQGDMQDLSLFPPRSFTHLSCFYFTIYYFENPATLFRNFFEWLVPGGYAIIHLVIPSKFDPLVDAASPFPAFSLQKYSKKRVTQSTVYFNNFVFKIGI